MDLMHRWYIMTQMTTRTYPDDLHPPDPAHVQHLLAHFWLLLAGLPELIVRDEHLLAGELTAGAAALRGGA